MRKIIPFFILWLSLSVACNFPARVATSGLERTTVSSTPGSLAGNALVETPARSSSATPRPFSTTLPLIGSPTAPVAVSTAGDVPAYHAQSGDTLEALAKRFGVSPGQVTSPQAIPPQGQISPGQLLFIPDRSGSNAPPDPVLPDSEVIDSPSASSFDLPAYVQKAGGYLSAYHQVVGSERLSGAQVVQRVVDQTSVNPRLLLAMLEFRSHWVTNPAPPNLNLLTPLGYNIPGYQGLYLELSLTAKLLNMGYYGWRQGSLTTLEFTDGKTARLAPRLNAGSVALQYLFSRLYPSTTWQTLLYGKDGLMALHTTLFGDAWARAVTVEPLFPAGLESPTLELPFAAGETWALTGGPHEDWNTGTPDGALDFAPIMGESHCAVSAAWARTAAPGTVIASFPGAVLLALDGSGGQPSGWVLLYYHIAQAGQAIVGAHLDTGEPVGHPSCEGGDTTGTNLHLARKYRGEWIGAGEPLPLVLSGWTAVPGAAPYRGTLVKGDQVVTADPLAGKDSRIFR